MPNDYYNHESQKPSDLTRGIAVEVRQELDAIVAGFGKLPARARLATNSVGFVNDTGGVNAFVLTGVPAVTALLPGMQVIFKAAYANSGPCTINVNGIGVRPVVRSDGQPLELGDIFASQIVTLTYDDAAGGRFQYASSAASATASARAYAQDAAGSALAASGSASAASGSAGAANSSALAAAQSEANAAQSALDAANSAGSTLPGYLEPVRVTTDTTVSVGMSVEIAAKCVVTLPTPGPAIAGRELEFVNVSGPYDQANCPEVDFGAAPLNRNQSPGLMKLTQPHTRSIRVTSTAPWGWIKA